MMRLIMRGHWTLWKLQQSDWTRYGHGHLKLETFQNIPWALHGAFLHCRPDRVKTCSNRHAFITMRVAIDGTVLHTSLSKLKSGDLKTRDCPAAVPADLHIPPCRSGRGQVPLNIPAKPSAIFTVEDT